MIEDKKGTYGTDLSKPISVLIENIRFQIVQSRGELQDINYHNKVWGDRLGDVEGLLTCGLVALHAINQDIIAHEIKADDAKLGRSLVFRPRGIGLDVCHCCFVCGAQRRREGANHYLNNIAAFVASKEEGEQIVLWFRFFKGKDGPLPAGASAPLTEGARLDYWESEPQWIQVKVGACDEHLANLKDLNNRTAVYGRIREYDIAESRKLAEPATV